MIPTEYVTPLARRIQLGRNHRYWIGINAHYVGIILAGHEFGAAMPTCAGGFADCRLSGRERASPPHAEVYMLVEWPATPILGAKADHFLRGKTLTATREAGPMA